MEVADSKVEKEEEDASLDNGLTERQDKETFIKEWRQYGTIGVLFDIIASICGLYAGDWATINKYMKLLAVRGRTLKAIASVEPDEFDRGPKNQGLWLLILLQLYLARELVAPSSPS
ncbi:hypothetical protein EJ02DRAFT_477986 [Clathrospora elynae]|uniref:Uncharacterized protein n=1 Tax=Clathrospora elynae TaxID=706981 RepID=A0A6A5SYH1_9PLEO|nr:hypothetical protein EJ02DRAFT_477986 [Clathrospora elynae]